MYMLLSAMNVFIRPKSDHCLPLSLSLTHCCLVDLTDMTLAFEDANSKILDVDIEESVDNSSVEVLKLRFGREVEPEFWSQY